MSTTTDTRQAVPAGTWTLDPVHSEIGFKVDYLVGTFRGRFRDVAAKLVDGQLTGSARVAAVEVKDENLEAHLQTLDFFDAERHPELTFESRDIDRSGEQLTVRGNITIKGVTRPVELTGTASDAITDYADRERIGLRLETTVDRTEFGLNWNMSLPSGEPALSNEVTLEAEL